MNVTGLSGSVSSYSSSGTESSSVSTETSSSSSASSTASSTDAADPPKSAICTTNSDHKKHTAVAAGVGAALGACLLLSLLTIYMQRRKYIKDLKNRAMMINALNESKPIPDTSKKLSGAPTPELSERNEQRRNSSSIHGVEGVMPLGRGR